MAFKNSKTHTRVPKAPSTRITRESELDRDQDHYVTTHMKQSLLYYTGIDIDQAGFSRDENDGLRIFEMTPDGEIVDVLNEIRADSGEFVEKIQQGRIFAFPAGEGQPVQLQFETGGMAASKPIDSSPFPQPDPPTGWMRFIHFFGGYKKEFQEYDAAKAKYDKSVAALQDMKEKRKDILQSEEETFKTEEELRKEEEQDLEKDRHARKLEQLRGPAQEYQDMQSSIQDVILDCYGTEPVMRDDYVASAYTLNEFAKLERYDITRLDVKEPITQRQFMSLGMLGAIRPENGGQIRLAEGTPPEQNSFSNWTFYTSDLSLGEHLRPRNTVGQYFEQGVQKGRKAAKEAIEAYQGGDPKPLGKLIGEGLHSCALYSDHGGSWLVDAATRNGIVGYSTQLLDRDPALMAAAREAGMTDDDLALSRGDVKLLEVIRRGEWAAERLKAHDAGEIQLSPEERRECIDARLTLAVADQQIMTEKTELAANPEAVGIQTKMGMELFAVTDDQTQQYKAIKKQVREGTLTQEQAEKKRAEIKEENDAKMEAISMKYLPLKVKAEGQPQVLRLLGGPEGDRVLQGLVSHHFPGRDKLYELQGEALEQALDKSVLFGENSPYAIPKAPDVPPVPVPKNEVKQTQPQQAEQEAEGPMAG